MATNVTYTSLITRIGAYIEKARVVGSTAYEQIPEIINYSEKAIVDELKLQGYEKTLRDFMQIGKSTYAKQRLASDPDLLVLSGTNLASWQGRYPWLLSDQIIEADVPPDDEFLCKVEYTADAIRGLSKPL